MSADRSGRLAVTRLDLGFACCAVGTATVSRGYTRVNAVEVSAVAVSTRRGAAFGHSLRPGHPEDLRGGRDCSAGTRILSRTVYSGLRPGSGADGSPGSGERVADRTRSVFSAGDATRLAESGTSPQRAGYLRRPAAGSTVAAVAAVATLASAITTPGRRRARGAQLCIEHDTLFSGRDAAGFGAGWICFADDSRTVPHRNGRKQHAARLVRRATALSSVFQFSRLIESRTWPAASTEFSSLIFKFSDAFK